MIPIFSLSHDPNFLTPTGHILVNREVKGKPCDYIHKTTKMKCKINTHAVRLRLLYEFPITEPIWNSVLA